MSEHIRKMTPQLSNKIAAGEVVDRPASVVKELVENSIDSGATEITVETEEAGRRTIRVTDNGSGIHEGDIPLIFERHATSKVYTEDDIRAIRTLGFRGEALASIASVSKVTLLSRTQASGTGFRLKWVEGNALSQERLSMSPGTVIAIEDLFFNAPARLKFLASDAAENRSINRMLNQLAIANPEIRFKFIQDGKIRTMTPGDGQMLSVLYPIYGRDLIDHMVTFDHTQGNVRFEGYITDLNYHRGNRHLQCLYVNGRYVENRLILDAVNDAYRALIPIHQFPAFFIKIHLDPEQVDVNVHPNKLRIKIDGEEEMADLLRRELRESLYRKKTHVAFAPETSATPAPEPAPTPVAPVPSTRPPVEPLPEFGQFLRENAKSTHDPDFEAVQVRLEERSTEHRDSRAALYDGLVYIGQALSTYLIFEKGRALYLLDQHAAHEKILYEAFMAAYRNQTFDSQQLLVPEILQTSREEAALCEAHDDWFRGLGYDLERFGEQEIALRGIPALFSAGQARDMLRVLLDQKDLGKYGHDRLLEEALIQRACKHAIKAHDKLRPIEANAMLASLRTLEDPLTCPHGRPIIIEFDQRALEKLFSRG